MGEILAKQNICQPAAELGWTGSGIAAA